MIQRRAWFVLISAVLFSGTARGDGLTGAGPKQDVPASLSLVSDDSAKALADNLRGILVQSLPPILYEDTRHWGQQKEVVRGVKWKGQGLHVHPEVMRGPKNHGSWWKVQIAAPNLADSLVLDLRDFRQEAPGRVTFTTFVSLDADVEYEKQNWDAGIRVYSGSIRARARVQLTLRCEVSARLEATGGLVPDVVFRLRVLQSDSHYDNLVVEHVAGVGGEAAKLLGAAVLAGMEQWHPSLERNLIAKANAAIVKAADTKEVRVSLLGLLGKK
jgi:hypothetical protein